jgi:hypothetical protein
MCVGFVVNPKGHCLLRSSLDNQFEEAGNTAYALTGLPTSAPTIFFTNSPTSKGTNSPTRKATRSPTRKATKSPTNKLIVPTGAPTAVGNVQRRCGNKGKIDRVCGFTPVKGWDDSTGQGQCYEVTVTYSRAQKICKSQGLGARLCTVYELRNKVAKSTGCGFDNKLVWTKSQKNCGRNGRKLVAGSGSNWSFKWSGEYDDKGKRLWIRSKRTPPVCRKIFSQAKAHVRCCSNDAEFTSDDGSDYYDNLQGDF